MIEPILITAIIVLLGLALFLSRLYSRQLKQVAELQRAIHLFPEACALPASSMQQSLDLARERVQQASALIEAERAKLATVLDSMQDWVVAVDSAGRIQWANEPMRRGLELTLRPGQAIVHAVRDPEVLLCLRVALEDGLLTERRSTSLIPGRIFRISAGPIPGGGAVAVLHDSTRIEQVERTQREFIANVSHELRTPLTSISGYVETLIDHERTLSPQAREFLETILKNATRMTRLTEDLLVLARVESGETKLTPEPVSAEKLVRDAVASVRGIAREAGASLDIGSIASDNVMADNDAIVQVLSNLIENATKYGRDGKAARIEVSSTRNNSHVTFRVRDWGPGIASEHMERIFERFYRIDKARSRETGGTGLGLAIARHIVQQHGGSIWVESILGQGSTFAFTLPMVNLAIAH